MLRKAESDYSCNFHCAGFVDCENCWWKGGKFGDVLGEDRGCLDMESICSVPSESIQITHLHLVFPHHKRWEFGEACVSCMLDTVSRPKAESWDGSEYHNI